jgi:hypothetical protein
MSNTAEKRHLRMHFLAEWFIDYRCDDEKNTLEFGRHLGIIAQLKTPGFQKCRSLTLSKHLFIRKLKKEKPLDSPRLFFTVLTSVVYG